MSNATNNLLTIISELGQEQQKEQASYEAKNDAWWNGLTEQEREDAFYAVVKRIYQGDVVENGSYRYVLYEVFGFDASMYVRGMDCGYMALHNSIKTDAEEQIVNEYYESRNRAIAASKQATVCKNKDEAGNCPLHNLHCTYPECEKKGEQV
jgi:hypothetical protein